MSITTQIFGYVDYIIFGLTLSLSAATGIYFGCFGSRQNTAKEYLYGKGNLKAIPIGLSLYSSAVSIITILGTPAEIYTFGTQFCMVYVGVILSLTITWNFVLPVFSGDLNIKNPYEYFELRFNSKIQTMASLVYIIHTILYMPVILYGGALVFSESTGISLAICSIIIGGVCIFYTLLGGFSAVIWSDTLQATIMLATCIFVMIKGVIDSGGLSEIWTIADRGQRLQFFNINLDPFQRLTFWSAVLGMCFNHAAHNGCGASAIQRYMVLKSEKGARLSTFIGVLGSAIIGWIGCIIGLSMYAFYSNCDPVTNKEINSPNKLVPHYISHIVSGIPGFLGLFNAGLISAGLSTISAELNTVAGLVYHCFIQKICKTPFSEKSGANIMKLIVFINGVYYLLVAPLLDKSKYLFPLALTIIGLTYGAKVGMMLLGTTFPKSNSTGVIAGTIASFIILGWISIGALFYDISKPYILPLSVDNCTFNLNVSAIPQTLNINTTEILSLRAETDPFFIYKLSIMYYPVLGTIITILVALMVSYFTGYTDLETLDPKLIIPRLRSKIKVGEEKHILEIKLLSSK